MMTKVLTAINLFTTAILIVLLMQSRTQLAAVQARDRPIRTQHIEIINSEGKVAASLGYEAPNNVPALCFYDKDGNRTMTLALDVNGHPSMYFLDKDYGPTVSLGYLPGGDMVPSPGEEDPGGWGMQIRTKAGEKSLSSFPVHPIAEKR